METNTNQSNMSESLKAVDQETKIDIEIVIKTTVGDQEDVKKICFDLNSLNLKSLGPTKLGWVDDDGDFISLGTDEEIKIALAEVGSGPLRMEMRKKGPNNKNTMNLPCQFMAQFRRAVEKESGEVMEVVVHQRQQLAGIQKVMQKWPGVIFLGGDTAGVIVGKGKGQQKLHKECQNDVKIEEIVVKRIMHDKLLENIINDQIISKSLPDEKNISIIFVPLIPERKKLHCHIFGNLADFETPCVAFKKRGNPPAPDDQGEDKDIGQEAVEQDSELKNKMDGDKKGTTVGSGSNTQMNQGHGTAGKEGGGLREIPKRRAKVLASSLLAKLKECKIEEEG